VEILFTGIEKGKEGKGRFPCQEIEKNSDLKRNRFGTGFMTLGQINEH
jgi:hypothetical protein